MPVRGIQAMGDDPGRSESGEEEEDFGSEDDDVITPLQDRLSWKSFFGRCLFSINIFLLFYILSMFVVVLSVLLVSGMIFYYLSVKLNW